MGKLLDKIVLVINVLGAAGMLLAYLAPLINPTRFVLPALFGLAYPYLLFANFLFLGYWLIWLKKEILISLVVILAGWNQMNNMLPFRLSDTKEPDRIPGARIIKVLSYNVRGFDIYKWSRDTATRSGIVEFVREQEPDIICFQEYYTSGRDGESHGDLASRLRFLPESSVYYTTDQFNLQGFGIATFSRYPILKRSRIPFNTEGNAAMYTDIRILDDTLRIFNIHLQSIRFKKEDYAFMDSVRFTYSNEQMLGLRQIGSQIKTAFERRAEQADMIANYIRDSPHPVVVMGDFNDTPQSYAYRKIRRGLHDAFRRAGRGFGNTYSGEMPSFRIDYILYSDPMVAYRFRRLKVPFSDHFPISSLLYLPGRSTSE